MSHKDNWGEVCYYHPPPLNPPRALLPQMPKQRSWRVSEQETFRFLKMLMQKETTYFSINVQCD